MDTMRISELAARSGVPVTTLRYYEEEGLLPAARTRSGYRLYDEEALERLAFIGRAKVLGLPLREIGGLLVAWDTGVCAHVRDGLWPRLAARLDAAERDAAAAGRLATMLRDALAHLDALPDRSGPCGHECEPAPPAPPVTCSLDAAGLAGRTGEWRALLAGARRTELADGVRVSVPVDRIAALAELAAAERRCCPFLDLRLRPDGDLVHLEVRAPGEARPLLDEVFVSPERGGVTKETAH